MEAVQEIISARYEELLRRISRGEDVPPAHALRLEGMLEMAVLLGLCDEQSLEGLLETLYRDVLGVTIADTLGDDWRQVMPFPALPLFMDRAPVYPSTTD